MSQEQDRRAQGNKLICNIKRQTRRKFNAEEKILVLLARLWGEDSIAELCRR